MGLSADGPGCEVNTRKDGGNWLRRVTQGQPYGPCSKRSGFQRRNVRHLQAVSNSPRDASAIRANLRGLDYEAGPGVPYDLNCTPAAAALIVLSMSRLLLDSP